nr:MAG TPA: hypothetical protein [Bacteriophage sp.]
MRYVSQTPPPYSHINIILATKKDRISAVYDGFSCVSHTSFPPMVLIRMFVLFPSLFPRLFYIPLKSTKNLDFTRFSLAASTGIERIFKLLSFP